VHVHLIRALDAIKSQAALQRRAVECGNPPLSASENHDAEY
jgi:hypothetical protein